MAQRRIELLGDVELRDMATDTPILENGKPAIWSHEKFLLSLPADGQFIDGLTGIDATELQIDTRKLIRSEVARGRGFIVVPEATFQRLLGAVKKPKNPFPCLSNVSICFYEYMRSVRDAKECDDDGNLLEKS